jgi:UDP-N-acetylmuramate--alanine ligase
MQAFQRFADRIIPDGVLVYCSDDAGAVALAGYAADQGVRAIAYSHKDSVADFYAAEMRSRPGQGFTFDFMQAGTVRAKVALQLPGLHNAQNAIGALAVAAHLGLDLADAASSLGDFRGTERRFQIRGEAAGILVIDDYGHHPTEIRAVLAAARARYPGRRLWAVWQPHTYSRTLTLRTDFGAAFKDADQVLVTGVYAAREQQPDGFDMQGILAAIDHPSVHFSAALDEAQDYLIDQLIAGDVLIVFSAGDAIHLSEKLYAQLEQKE